MCVENEGILSGSLDQPLGLLNAVLLFDDLVAEDTNLFGPIAVNGSSCFGLKR